MSQYLILFFKIILRYLISLIMIINNYKCVHQLFQILIKKKFEWKNLLLLYLCNEYMRFFKLFYILRFFGVG